MQSSNIVIAVRIPLRIECMHATFEVTLGCPAQAEVLPMGHSTAQGVLPCFQITPFHFEALWFKKKNENNAKQQDTGVRVGGVRWTRRCRLFYHKSARAANCLAHIEPTIFLGYNYESDKTSLHCSSSSGQSYRTTARWQLKASKDGSIVSDLYFAARVTLRRRGTNYINLLLDPTYKHASNMTFEILQPHTGIRTPDRLPVTSRYGTELSRSYMMHYMKANGRYRKYRYQSPNSCLSAKQKKGAGLEINRIRVL